MRAIHGGAPPLVVGCLVVAGVGLIAFAMWEHPAGAHGAAFRRFALRVAAALRKDDVRWPVKDGKGRLPVSAQCDVVRWKAAGRGRYRAVFAERVLYPGMVLRIHYRATFGRAAAARGWRQHRWRVLRCATREANWVGTVFAPARPERFYSAVASANGDRWARGRQR